VIDENVYIAPDGLRYRALEHGAGCNVCAFLRSNCPVDEAGHLRCGVYRADGRSIIWEIDGPSYAALANLAATLDTENALLRKSLLDYMRADITANGEGAGCYTLPFIADLADMFGLDPWPSSLSVQP